MPPKKWKRNLSESYCAPLKKGKGIRFFFRVPKSLSFLFLFTLFLLDTNISLWGAENKDEPNTLIAFHDFSQSLMPISEISQNAALKVQYLLPAGANKLESPVSIKKNIASLATGLNQLHSPETHINYCDAKKNVYHYLFNKLTDQTNFYIVGVDLESDYLINTQFEKMNNSVKDIDSSSSRNDCSASYRPSDFFLNDSGQLHSDDYYHSVDYVSKSNEKELNTKHLRLTPAQKSHVNWSHNVKIDTYRTPLYKEKYKSPVQNHIANYNEAKYLRPFDRMSNGWLNYIAPPQPSPYEEEPIIIEPSEHDSRVYIFDDVFLSAQKAWAWAFGESRFVHNGGQHNTANNLILGYYGTAYGIYEFNDGSLSTQATLVGYLGNGVFTHNNGSHTTQRLFLGVLTGSGLYNMYNGELSVSDINIGDNHGSGIFNQNGGVVQTNWLTIAYDNPDRNHLVSDGYEYAPGTYTLNSGSLFVNNVFKNGYNGFGTFVQTGGIHNSSTTQVQEYYGSNHGYGAYIHTGGTHYADIIYLGSDDTIVYNEDGTIKRGKGYYYMSGDSTSLFVTDLNIGDLNAAGHFKIDGGNVMSNWLAVGVANGVGLLEINGGTVMSSLEHIGYSATGLIKQQGGIHTSNIMLFGFHGGSGRYDMFGGQFFGVETYLGVQGDGYLNLQGGAFYSEVLIAGAGFDSEFQHSSYGEIVLDGDASATTHDTIVGIGQGSGKFVQKGGTHSTQNLIVGASTVSTENRYEHLGGTLYSTVLSIGEGDGGNGTFLLDGGVHKATQILVGSYGNSQGKYVVRSGDLETHYLLVGVDTKSKGSLCIESPASIVKIVGTNDILGSIEFGSNASFSAVKNSQITLRNAAFIILQGADPGALSDLENLSLVFDQAASINEIEVPGIDYGATDAGLSSTNFMLDALIFDATASAPIDLYLFDLIDNTPDDYGTEALYVETIKVIGNTIVSLYLEGVNLYYKNIEGNIDQITQHGTGNMIKLPGAPSPDDLRPANAPVPEPSAMFLTLLGGILLFRHRSHQKH